MAIRGKWGPWSDWSDCSEDCGEGIEIRTRSIAIPAQNGGAPCTGPSEETRSCNLGPCCENDSITVNTVSCDTNQVGTTVVNVPKVDGCDSVITTITSLAPSYNIAVKGNKHTF